MQEVYLDWAATAPTHPLALQVYKETAEAFYGNPSSAHDQGVKAAQVLTQARDALALNLGCRAEELYFTSGATEANNMIVFSLLKQALTLKKDFNSYSLVISGIEHPSIWEPVLSLKKWGFRVTVLNPDANGMITPVSLEAALERDTVMVLVMLINNETGAIQPVPELAERVRSFSRSNGRRIIFHCDIVQALGKIPLSLPGLGVDSASMSAHKLGAVKGTGALFLARDLGTEFLYRGGDQEKGRRPGTENVAGICSFSRLVQKQINDLKNNSAHAEQIMDFLLEGLRRIPGAVIFPGSRPGMPGKHFSPYILDLAFAPVPGEVAVRVLNDHHIAVSTGSACHSRKKERTRILESMGVTGDTARQAVRVSLGPATSTAEIAYFLETAKTVLGRLEKNA